MYEYNTFFWPGISQIVSQQSGKLTTNVNLDIYVSVYAGQLEELEESKKYLGYFTRLNALNDFEGLFFMFLQS